MCADFFFFLITFFKKGQKINVQNGKIELKMKKKTCKNDV